MANEQKVPEVAASLNHAADMRLDPISIPIFDGSPANWLVFKDMFETLVHNRTDLDPTYKLGKLRQYVKSDNVPLIGGLYTGGYEEVWAALRRRFDNPRILSETHVQRLLDLPNQPHESQKVLCHIVDCVRNSFRALAVMGVPVSYWDAIAVPIILPKLPISTRTEWGMSLTTNDIPKLEHLLVFLERRANNLPATITSNSAASIARPSSRAVRAHIATTTVQSTQAPSGQQRAVACVQCADPHRLIKCPRFRNLSVEERWSKVRGWSLCFNCLRAGHGTRDCPSGVCTKCQQKHNTLLCRKCETTTPVAEPDNASAAQPPAMRRINETQVMAPQVYTRQQ
ncbi:uncharacterized protein LOC118756550 [Rhagoletis pomonella]|uniref:uncharacterized protein LOC118756550 n=1 Tax=Rhagoletis pomonella TaxID=28610 RepID=UPI00177E42B9|nr:uncharacterized protein LOC118756550 [Rhagoletis pomonella]